MLSGATTNKEPCPPSRRSSGSSRTASIKIAAWIFSRRKQGIAITKSHIVYKASAILRQQQENAFKDKAFEARCNAVSCWLLKHNYVNRTKMNKGTRSPAEVYKEATLFMAANCPSLHGLHCDPRWILNMDQMLVYFSYHRSKMLKRGIKTVHMCKSTSDTRQATCALTCTAAGNFLRPMLIYKGKLTGCIATREFKHHDPSLVYACQDAAWMDEVCMLRWVKEVLKLYLKA